MMKMDLKLRLASMERERLKSEKALLESMKGADMTWGGLKTRIIDANRE